jgi:myosin protein heavy chain
MSMPAQLHITEADEVDGAREIQFAPLVAALDPHTKRRLRRSHLSEEMNNIDDRKKEEAKLRKAYAELRSQLKEKENTISELEFELESSRLGHIDMSEDQTEELQKKLEAAREEIEQLRASSPYLPDSRELSAFTGDGTYEYDDDGIMLVEPEDLGLSQDQMKATPLPNGVYGSRALESSQITLESLTSIETTTRDVLAEASQTDPAIVPDRISDQAVQRYETEIQTLTTQIATVESSLRIVVLELQNLNIVNGGPSVTTILTELRHVLEDSREEYEKLSGNSTVGLTQVDFLHKLIEELKGTSTELLEKTTLAEKLNQRATLFERQYEGVIDLLADADACMKELEKTVADLNASKLEADNNIIDLNDRLDTMHQAAEDMDVKIRQRDNEISCLKDDLGDKDTGLDRLKTALESYRDEVQTLTGTVTRLEQEHADIIAQMEQDHAALVQEYQTQLDSEADARMAAEEDANQKTNYIDELEGRITELDNQFEDINTQLTQLSQRLAEETQSRETAESERDEQADFSYQQAITIENLNETVRDLESDIETFRANLETERTQRQQTEADLDDANERIEELNNQLHNAGIQANELRSKLFQAQLERDEAVASLEAEAQAREDEHAEILGAETQHRMDAEQQVQDLETRIAQLEQDLSDTEVDLNVTTAARDTLEVDRDEQVTKLNRQLEDLRQKYTALETSSKSTIDTLQATITDLTNTVNALRNTVEDLEDAALETSQQHADEIANRNATIEDLENELENSRAENTKLAGENASLAKRVENEASELLNIMGAHAEEANALRQVIKTQEAHIADLKYTAEQQADTYAAEIAEKEEELEDRRIVGDARSEHILTLESQLEELKERFRVQAEDSQNTIQALLDTNLQAIAQQEQLAAANRERTVEALKAVAEMKVKGFEVKTNGVNLKKVVNGKVTKTSEKVKVSKKKSGGRKKSAPSRDSGFVELMDDEDWTETLRDEGVVG